MEQVQPDALRVRSFSTPFLQHPADSYLRSSDNPPPKVVQGYKFNIFYPDLIDKTKAPRESSRRELADLQTDLPCPAEYRIVKNKENPDICTIVFSAGPPYEDIAFTIVNKPWEHSHKRGFRSSFDRGVLQLHFSFRRNFYRCVWLAVLALFAMLTSLVRIRK